MVDELQASRERLEAARLRLAVRVSPMTARILRAADPTPEGMVAWTPEEMFRYVGLEPKERRVWAGLKMRFDASTTFMEQT